MTQLLRFLRSESGVTAIEYGLIGSIMGLVLVAVMPILATAIVGSFSSIAGHISSGQ
jgi:Flp pilus assembly pilin Flp